jgi:hypothetical protein
MAGGAKKVIARIGFQSTSLLSELQDLLRRLHTITISGASSENQECVAIV